MIHFGSRFDVTEDDIVEPEVIEPVHHGIKAWTYDPIHIHTPTVSVAGTRYMLGIRVREAITVSRILYSIGTGAVTPTAGQNWASLYESDGDRIANVGLDGESTSGLKDVAITPVALAAGLYYLALLFNAATPPQLHRTSSGSVTAQNALLAAAAMRFAINGTVQTTNPTSLVLANNVSTNALPYWAGLA